MDSYVVTAAIRIAEADSREDAVSQAYLLLENAIAATQGGASADVALDGVVDIIDVERVISREIQYADA